MILKRSRTHRRVRMAGVILCATAIAPSNSFALALSTVRANMQDPSPASAQASSPEAPRIPNDQLDSLVAPIALYPDPLLAQILAASTYPLELMQLHQWLQKNPLKDKALADAVAKQPWDPSIQAMAALPDVVKRLVDDIQWTTDLGNSFLAQQDDVMDAVQRMRAKAQEKGNLQSTAQQTVETQVVQNERVIVIEQASPEVIYVPSYDPYAVWGAPIYPYPPIYYPSYVAGAAISFGVGVAIGAAWGGGGWGWGCRWGDNDITINNNNNFNRNANIRSGNTNVGNRSNWQHRPEHRGGAPYRDRATANRYGGTARGDSLAQRQTGARQQVQRQGGNVRSGAVGTSGVGDRSISGDLGSRSGGSLGERPGTTSLGGGGADRVGTRDLSGSSGSGSRGAFGDSGGFSGSSARSSSSRGSSSMRSSGGGGMSRGGGGMSRGGGGSRGGGRR